MASDDAKICYQNTIFANGFWQNAESNESLSESDAKAMLAEFRAVEIQASDGSIRHPRFHTAWARSRLSSTRLTFARYGVCSVLIQINGMLVQEVRQPLMNPLPFREICVVVEVLDVPSMIITLDATVE